MKELTEAKGSERPSNLAATDEPVQKAPKAKAKGHEQTRVGIYAAARRGLASAARLRLIGRTRSQEGSP